MLEDAIRDVLLALVEDRERAVEVLPNDLAGSPELRKRRGPKLIRPAFGLDLPEPLHHQLQIGRLDPRRVVGSSCLIEHRGDELRFDDDPVVRRSQVVELLHRAEDGGRCCLSVEAIETYHVGEQVRECASECVELRESVVSEREEDVGTQPRPDDHLGQLGEQGSRVALGSVVYEELLELVEHDEDLSIENLGPVVDGVGEARRGRRPCRPVPGDLPHLVGDRARQSAHRVARPCREDDGNAVRATAGRSRPGNFADSPRDPCAEERSLPDAARSVEHRESGGEEIRDDDFDLALSSEEEQRVELALAERRQSAERCAEGWGSRHGHAGASAASIMSVRPRT